MSRDIIFAGILGFGTGGIVVGIIVLIALLRIDQ